MTQNQIRSGGAPRAERPHEVAELPNDAEAAEAAGAADAEAGGAPRAERPHEVAELSNDAADAEGLFEDEEPERVERPKLPISERLKRTPPALVILTIATVGSSGFLAWQLASRTAPISLLTASGVVTGLVYVAVTIVCAVATYRAGYQGRTGRAFLLASVGGVSALAAALSFAGALLLFLALGF
jgi:hypothetical protein